MQRLYLVRHGIAVPSGTPGYEDDLRPLTSRGVRRMRQNARGLRRLGVTVDRIVTSPLPRALRTAEILADALGLTKSLAQDDVLRSGNPAEAIQGWLDRLGDENLMIVGHDPAFSELVGNLVAGHPVEPICSMRKGGAAALVANEAGGYQLEWLATPRLLRRQPR